MEAIGVLLMYLGVSPPEMLAGFCGSVLFASTKSDSKVPQLVLTMLGHTLAANYVGGAAGAYVGQSGGHVGAFLVGFLGPLALRKFAPKLFEEQKNA